MEKIISKLHKDKLNLSQNIDKYLIPNELERKGNAEISTPYKLRQEMLDTITKYGDADFWKTPKKVFEPCCGKGGFLIDVVARFMDGLVEKIPDEKERYKTIVEECLYWADINPTNIFICKMLLDPADEYKLNYSEGDTLKLDINEKWNLEGFDLVVGNPPYQKNFKNKNGRVGGSSLWSAFINYSIDIIKEDGYLLFITPCSWMTGGSNKQSGNILNGVMKKNTILYLNIEECSKHFNNVGSTFSYYCIKKSLEDMDFNCDCKYKSKIYSSVINNSLFRELNVVPKLFNKEMVTLIKKIENHNSDKFSFKRVRDLDSSAQKSRYTEKGKYKVRHKVVDIRHSDWEQECMNKDKILISMPGYLKTMYDKECGCSDATLFMYVKDEEEAKELITILNSNVYKLIINSYRELTGLNNHKNINRLSIIKNINDADLTPEEIKLIEDNI